jgi:uroporphyrinogen decarboxylase
VEVWVHPKENLWRAITHEGPEYVPVRRLDGSIAGLHRTFYRGSRPAVTGEVDRWGVRWSAGTPAGQAWEPEIQGYPLGAPLRDLDELDAYPFPDGRDPLLTDGLLDGVDRHGALVSGEIYFPLFDRAHFLVGIEAFFEAMIARPDTVRALLHRIADYHIGVVEQFVRLGVDIIRFAEDYGGQQSLLISPRMWRSFIKPEMARLFAVAKEADRVVWLHTCGHVMEIVPDLIEIGLDVLDPLQARANDQGQIKSLYGDRLCIMGGIDTQDLLTRGTPEQVTAEVRDRIRLLGPGGGYILAPDTLLPVPEQNYHAYLAAGERYGRYPLNLD